MNLMTLRKFVYILVSNTEEDGNKVFVFSTAEEQENTYKELVADLWEKHKNNEQMPEDVEQAYATLCEIPCFCDTIDKHEENVHFTCPMAEFSETIIPHTTSLIQDLWQFIEDGQGNEEFFDLRARVRNTLSDPKGHTHYDTEFSYWWNWDYRHYLRDASADQRLKMYNTFIGAGLCPSGSSELHFELVQKTFGEI